MYIIFRYLFIQARANTIADPQPSLEVNLDSGRIERIKEHCQCTICLELPRSPTAVYQCSMGHLYCQGTLILNSIFSAQSNYILNRSLTRRVSR